MPMSERDATFRITADLEQARVWELIEARVTLSIECVSCHRHAAWPPDLIKLHLRRDTGKRLTAVAGKLRCAGCHSAFVRISRERVIGGPKPAKPPAATEAAVRPDPAEKRGFTDRNLDANARGRQGL